MKSHEEGGVRTVAAGCLAMDEECDEESQPCQEADGHEECSDCCDDDFCTTDAIRNGLENSSGATIISSASVLTLTALTMVKYLVF